MLESIQAYEASKKETVKHTTFVKSDDGTIVFFKDNYDQATGKKLPNEVVKTTTKKEVEDEIAKKTEEIATLQSFLTEIK